MLNKFLHTLRDTIDEVGSQAAAIASDVSSQVDALADAVSTTASDASARWRAATSSGADRDTDIDSAADADVIDDRDRAGPGVLGKTVTLLALGGVLYAGWTQWNAVHRKRSTSRLRALPEPLHRWEGEGGQNQMVAESAPLAGHTSEDDTLTAAPSSTRPPPPKEL